MPLLSVTASKKIETNIRLEESTAKLLDQYAAFLKAGSADDVVNKALEYVFTKDKDFQQHLEQNPDAKVPSLLRVKKVPAAPKPATSAAK
jgi:hypothetical protein